MAHDADDATPASAPGHAPEGSRASRLLRNAGTAALVLAVALGAYGGIRLLLAYRDLPPGTCPYDLQRPVFLAALVFALLSLVLSLFEKPRRG